MLLSLLSLLLLTLLGRKLRASSINGNDIYEERAVAGQTTINDVNLAEKQAFMDGDKLVAIISDAASSGISLHADKRVANQRRRVHITLELAWSSDKAVQQLGRTHRSNQSSAPEYVLLISSQAGENRFGSAVCKRLQSMGALTQADRSASSGSQTLDAFNYETSLGKKALKKLVNLITENKEGNVKEPDFFQLLPTFDNDNDDDNRLVDEVAHSLNIRPSDVDFPLACGEWLEMIDFKTSTEDIKVKKFLNRILGLQTKKQNYLFDAFEAIFEEVISIARKKGTYDNGISRVQGTIIDPIEEPKVIRSHDYLIVNDIYHSESTDHAVIKTDRGITWNQAVDISTNKKKEFEDKQKDLRKMEANTNNNNDNDDDYIDDDNYGARQKQFGFYKSEGGAKTYVVCCSEQLPTSYNKLRPTIQLWRPRTGRHTMGRKDFSKKYEKIGTMMMAQQLWEKEYNNEDGYGERVSETDLVVGSVLPVWSVIDKAIREANPLKEGYKIKIMKAKAGNTNTNINTNTNTNTNCHNNTYTYRFSAFYWCLCAEECSWYSP